MAPEMAFMGDDKYSTSVDIWAFGVMFYELLFGEKPFPAKNFSHLKILINKGY